MGQLVVEKEMMDKTIKNMISAQERQTLTDQIELNVDGRFPCRFIGCSKSFKYNGKSRKNHELSHDPPVVILEDNLDSTPTTSTVSPSKGDDDMFNYNTALLAEGVIVKKTSPKNLSVDCRSTVGRLSTDSRPTVGRLSAVCRPTVGRLLADRRPTDLHNYR